MDDKILNEGAPSGKTSALGSFLKHFGGGDKGDEHSAPPQPDSQPPPQQPLEDVSSFSSRLNGNNNGGQPNVDAVDMPPSTGSMEGARVVSEPSPMSLDTSVGQTQLPSQEVPTPDIGLGSDAGQPTNIGTQQPTAEFNTPPITPEPPAVTPDLSSVSIQEEATTKESGALIAATESLTSATEAIKKAQEKINEALDPNPSSGRPAQEPVETGS